MIHGSYSVSLLEDLTEFKTLPYFFLDYLNLGVDFDENGVSPKK